MEEHEESEKRLLQLYSDCTKLIPMVFPPPLSLLSSSSSHQLHTTTRWTHNWTNKMFLLPCSPPLFGQLLMVSLSFPPLPPLFFCLLLFTFFFLSRNQKPNQINQNKECIQEEIAAFSQETTKILELLAERVAWQCQVSPKKGREGEKEGRKKKQ